MGGGEDEMAESRSVDSNANTVTLKSCNPAFTEAVVKPRRVVVGYAQATAASIQPSK